MKPKPTTHSAKRQARPQLYIIRRWQNHPAEPRAYLTEGKDWSDKLSRAEVFTSYSAAAAGWFHRLDEIIAYPPPTPKTQA